MKTWHRSASLKALHQSASYMSVLFGKIWRVTRLPNNAKIYHFDQFTPGRHDSSILEIQHPCYVFPEDFWQWRTSSYVTSLKLTRCHSLDHSVVLQLVVRGHFNWWNQVNKFLQIAEKGSPHPPAGEPHRPPPAPRPPPSPRPPLPRSPKYSSFCSPGCSWRPPRPMSHRRRRPPSHSLFPYFALVLLCAWQTSSHCTETGCSKLGCRDATAAAAAAEARWKTRQTNLIFLWRRNSPEDLNEQQDKIKPLLLWTWCSAAS